MTDEDMSKEDLSISDDEVRQLFNLGAKRMLENSKAYEDLVTVTQKERELRLQELR